MAGILIVDDNFRIRKLLRDILALRDYVIHEAADPVAARELLSSQRIDLIFLDVLLPETDGFAYCAEIRATPAVSHIPIIITTGLGDTDNVRKAYQVGASDYIVKPFTLMTVMEKVDKYLPGG